MRPASARFFDAIKVSHQISTKVSVLKADEIILEADTISAGTVTLDQTAASRGRCDLSFVDDGSFNIAPMVASDPMAPYGNELRVQRGVLYPDGTDELISLGVFRINDVTITEAGSALTVQVQGMDRSAAMIDARFENPYEVVEGTNYVTAITDCLLQAFPGLNYNFATTAMNAPQLMAEEGADRWAFAQAMASAIGMSLYFDGDGVCVLRPVASLDSVPSWDVVEGQGGLLLRAGRKWSRTGAFNRVVVTGENSGGVAPFRGEATDSNPNSPTYYSGPFGRVPRFVRSSLIASNAQAADAASGILARELGTTQQIDFGAIVNPALEPDDMVLVRRERAGINETHVIDQLTIPLEATTELSATTRMTLVVAQT